MPLHEAERLSNAADAIIALDQRCPLSAMRSWMHRTLRRCSRILSRIFFSASKIFTRFQTKGEVAKIQDEFLRVFRTKDLQQLARFHRQLDIIAEGYRAQSVSF